MSNEHHPHWAAIQRVGTAEIMRHFDIKARQMRNWRVRGVPRTYRKAFIMFAAAHGQQVPEVEA